MKIDLKKCSEEELWVYVATHLKKNDIDTILVGGAVVSIYSNGAYQSGDLDLIKVSIFSEKLEPAMKEIGFKKHGRHYVNSECKHLFVEFPGTAPVGIGEDKEINPVTKKYNGVEIKLLSPTDCVKDRLASYLYFKSRDGLDQAVLVAKNHPINFTEVKRWCSNEGSLNTYEEFFEQLKREGNK